jgi:N-methylhydantoinase A/oxoprolinase/acetone carboxylase beta subunit/N-methylhydantoinase B/oxoprolinase/acetone carboxylase alpha subunit
MRIGVDIGGTFTDIVGRRDDGVVFVEKVLSSVNDYSEAIVEGISRILGRAGVSPKDVREVVHGTTVATNAILERRGAHTALLTTRGFRDVLDIRNSRRPEMYNIDWVKPPVLVERYLRLEVDERLDAHGDVLQPLDLASVDTAIARLRRERVDSVAVCLLNAFANPDHERRVGARLRDALPGVSVSLSCEVLPEVKEYERTSTTVINAYVRPVVERYLRGLVGRLGERGIHAPLLTMQSNGGVASASSAMERPISIVESGPAAGVIGAVALGRRSGHGKLVTFDMGGTTAKAALVEDGEIRLTHDLEVGGGLSAVSRLNKGGGYALSTPSVDVAETGVGGGSIAWLDEGNAIRVGPQSAGARPGPVCYGLGGDRATVTDANLVLGYLNPGALVGGDLQIDIERARAVIRRDLAGPLGVSVEEAAYGVHLVANSGMTRAIRAISTERGRDPRDAVLVAFGGNGPVHACELARTLGMQKVVVPPAPGVFSAFGLLDTAVEHSYSHTHMRVLDQANLAGIHAAFSELRTRAEGDVAGAGYGSVAIEWLYSADVRYRGQASQLLIRLQDGLVDAEAPRRIRADFEQEHERTFGYRSPEEHLEVVNLRLSARVTRVAEADIRGTRLVETRWAGGERRRAYFGPERGWLEAPVLQREALQAAAVDGPAIIEQYDTTIVLPPGSHAALDTEGNIVIDLAASTVAAALTDPRFDAVTREIVRHGLEALADEMALTLIRTCRSGHVKHSGDFSTAVADASGQLLAQGLTLPFHLGALPDALAAVLQKFHGDIHPGDVFILNDPFGGGMHLPDVFIIKPVFREEALVAMTASIVHQVDIGGRTAGGNSTLNTEIYAEGLRLPLMKLYDRGQAVQSIFEIIRANVRVPTKVIGDIRAQLAACHTGEREYLALTDRYGVENLRRYQRQLLDASEAIARETIAGIPDGRYEFEDYLDGDSIDPDPVTINVVLNVAGDRIQVDCGRSSRQVRGAINSTLSVTKSMAYTALRCLMPAHASTNAGYMRPIDVHAPPGSVLNGVLPAAGAGRAATGYRLMDVVFGALALALPDRIMAAGDGSPVIFGIGGYDEERRPFVFVDLMRGSWGGRPRADGLDGTSLAVSTGSSVPAEVVALEHPVQLDFCGYVTDSCGAGMHRGGMAVMREYRLLAEEATLQYRSERRKFRPYGVQGGHPGSASIVLWNPEGEAKLLPEKGEIRMRRGDVIRFCQASGGGYGDPLERDPQQVARDVRDELIGPSAARDLYGVHIDPETGKPDEAQTARLRTALRQSRDPLPKQPQVYPVTQENVAFMIAASHDAKRGGGNADRTERRRAAS